MAGRQIVVEIVGDASKFNRATTDAINGTTSLTGKLRNVGKGMVVDAGIGAFNLLTNAISGAVGMMGEMRTAYQEDAASQAKLVTALRANVAGWDGQTAAIEKVIAAQMRLGFSDDEQRASLAELSGITKDLTDAQNLQSLAMDLARFKNMDLGAASDLVGKVYGGNLGILSRYGIILKEGATATEALAAIQRMAGGQAEAYADTSLGKEAAAHLKVGEAMEKVGGAIDKVASIAIPILADAITGLVDGFSAFWDATEPIRETLGPVLEKIFSGIGVVMGGAVETIKTIIGHIQQAIELAQKLVGMLPGAGTSVTGFEFAAFNKQFEAKFGRPATKEDFERWNAGEGLPTRAAGGPVWPGGTFLVGEQGPEILHMGSGRGSITPNGAIGGLTIAPGAIVIQGATDPEATARAVMQAFQRERERQGMSFA